MTVRFVCGAPICFVNSSDLVALFRHSLDVFCMRGDESWRCGASRGKHESRDAARVRTATP